MSTVVDISAPRVNATFTLDPSVAIRDVLDQWLLTACPQVSVSGDNPPVCLHHWSRVYTPPAGQVNTQGAGAPLSSATYPLKILKYILF